MIVWTFIIFRFTTVNIHPPTPRLSLFESGFYYSAPTDLELTKKIPPISASRVLRLEACAWS